MFTFVFPTIDVPKYISLPPGIFISIDLLPRSAMAGPKDIRVFIPRIHKDLFKKKKRHDEEETVERHAGAK